MNTEIERIVQRVSKFASLPEIFLKVEEVLEQPNSGASDLARVIEGDPALTARLLRLVNSAVYGQVSKIEEVPSAVVVMGTAQLRELVLACSVVNAFQSNSSDILDLEFFWRHSIACGVLARSFGMQKKEANVERFLVAGLLHDIGRLVLIAERPQAMADALAMAREQRALLFRVEQDQLGFTHAELGGHLLQNWALSTRLVESTTWHHAPAGAKNFPLDAGIVHVADLMVNALVMGSSGETLVPALDPDAWNTLDLTVPELDQAPGILQEQYRDAVAFILDP